MAKKGKKAKAAKKQVKKIAQGARKGAAKVGKGVARGAKTAKNKAASAFGALKGKFGKKKAGDEEE